MSRQSFNSSAEASGIGNSNAPDVARRTGEVAQMIDRELSRYRRGPVEFSDLAKDSSGMAITDATKNWRGPKDSSGMAITKPLPEKISIIGPEAEEYFARKAKLSEHAKTTGGTVIYDDKDIAYLRAREAESDVIDFHTWLHGFVNYREPGKLAWLNKIYPGFFQGKIEQIKDDYAIQWRVDFLKHFGVHTFDDLMFAYGRHRGDIMTKNEREGFMNAHANLNGFQFGAFKPNFNSLHETKMIHSDNKIPYVGRANIGGKAGAGDSDYISKMFESTGKDHPAPRDGSAM